MASRRSNDSSGRFVWAPKAAKDLTVKKRRHRPESSPLRDQFGRYELAYVYHGTAERREEARTQVKAYPRRVAEPMADLTHVVVMESTEAGLNPVPALPWTVLCMRHRAYLAYQTESAARLQCVRVCAWCVGCRYGRPAVKVKPPLKYKPKVRPQVTPAPLTLVSTGDAVRRQLAEEELARRLAAVHEQVKEDDKIERMRFEVEVAMDHEEALMRVKARPRRLVDELPDLTHVLVIRSPESGLDPCPVLPWTVLCGRHRTYLANRTEDGARVQRARVTAWCLGCRYDRPPLSESKPARLPRKA